MPKNVRYQNVWKNCQFNICVKNKHKNIKVSTELNLFSAEDMELVSRC